MTARRRDCHGQATIELVAAVPLLLLVSVVVAQLLAAGLCRELAASAAEAGAKAVLQGGEPIPAARRVLPGWTRGRAQIRVHGRRVEVRLRPPRIAPVLSGLLVANDAADAGPAA